MKSVGSSCQNSTLLAVRSSNWISGAMRGFATSFGSIIRSMVDIRIP